MKELTKHIECGKYDFNVSIDRDIAVKALEEVPELSAYIFETAKTELNTKVKKNVDEVDILVSNIKNKKTSELIEQEKNLQECVKFAFPLMLKKAGSNLNAKEIIDYIYENGVDDEFNAGIYEMILLGFTQRGVVEKKIGFSMK